MSKASVLKWLRTGNRKPYSPLAVALIALSLLVLVSATVHAADTGTISGTVNVNGASVSATNSVSGASYITQSAGGSYTLSDLPVGTYSLHVVAIGYDYLSGSGYTVTANTTAAINITMAAGTPGADSEIDIQRPATASITDGGTDNIGTSGPGSVSLTYTIDNTAGNNHLLLASPTASNLVNASDFAVTAQPPSAIAGGNSGNFTVQFTVDSSGPFSFDMEIGNSDADEGAYNISISGTGGPVSVGGDVYPTDKLPLLTSFPGIASLAALAIIAGALGIRKLRAG